MAGKRQCPFPPHPALPRLACSGTLSWCISCALPLAFSAPHRHLPPTPGCCTSEGDVSQIHGKVPTNNILQLCSAASSIHRHCQASAARDLMHGTLHDQTGKGRETILCLAAGITITTVNNHSLKPRYSFTPSQLQNGTRRMVARGDVTWPELPA